MGRWGRGGSKSRADEKSGGAAKADSQQLTPLQLVTNCEPEVMLEQLRSNEDGLDQLGPDGWGTLHHAASLGMRGHIEALLDAKANALLKTTAPVGSFAKGITALQVAQSVHKAGRGDRTQVIEILQLGVQANGWGDWRTLKASDGQRQASMASSGTLPTSSTRAKRVSSSTNAQATVSVAKLDEAVAAAEDRVRWAMRNELAARESATQLIEIQLLEAKERESGCQHRVRLMEGQLDAMSARERDAKAAAAVASAAKDAAERATEAAENRATTETVSRRRAVAAAKEAQTQSEQAYARAEAAETESNRLVRELEVAQRAREKAEAAQAEAQLAAQRQAEQLKAMVSANDGDAGAAPQTDGPLQQIMVQVAQLKERCKSLASDLEAAATARVKAEMETARLETTMREQAAAAAEAARAAAESAGAAAAEAAKTLQEEVDRRVTVEERNRKTAQDLDLERARAAQQLERHQAALAAQLASQEAEILRSRHGTAVKALARMAHRGLGRAFGGWLATVQRLKRHRGLLRRSAGRFAHGAIARAFNSWLVWADNSRQLGAAARNAMEQLQKSEQDLRAVETARATLAAQVVELQTQLVEANARNDAAIARIQAEAQQERKTLRAAVLRPEAAAQAAKLEAEFLARQTAFYSRQLALTSRHHARYVTSVAAAMGERRGPSIVPHATLTKAALPLAVGAEIMPGDTPSTVRLSPHSADAAGAEQRRVKSPEEIEYNTANDGKQQWQQEEGKKDLLQLPKQQAAYCSNALAALEVLFTSVSMSFSSARSEKGDGDATERSEAGTQSARGQENGPPQQELALLAIGTLQQDILSYLRRHPQSTAMQWLEDSGVRVSAGSRLETSAGGVGVSFSPRLRSTSPSGLEGVLRAYSSPDRQDVEKHNTRTSDFGNSSSGSRQDFSTGRARRRRRPMSAQPAIYGAGSSDSSSLRRVKRPSTAGSRSRNLRPQVEHSIDTIAVRPSRRALPQPIIDAADI